MRVEIRGLICFEVLREIRVTDDLRAGFEKLRVVAGVIGMVVRYDDKLYRFGCHGFDLVDESGVILVTRQLTVDEDYAIVGDADQGVRAGSRHHIQAGLHWLNRRDRLPASACLREDDQRQYRHGSYK